MKSVIEKATNTGLKYAAFPSVTPLNWVVYLREFAGNSPFTDTDRLGADSSDLLSHAE
ncbi:MAG: hypothetical protein MJA83_10760 [Gammaproteobacteria bacterium]|nr:hypothetical protein [Gammaproteobacteria bacterium]